MKKPVYLDYNATTPLDPAVIESMKLYLEEEFGNASSNTHCYGWECSSAVEKARAQVAELIGAEKDEVIFTSGATESNNMAILGLIKNFLKNQPHIITSAIEHKAVLDVCKMAETMGAELTILPVDEFGQTHLEQVQDAIKPNTKLISIMMANNEIGTINPIKQIGELAKSKGIFFHTDAAQTLGKLPIDVSSLNVDMLSISGHKIYGPKGVGALYIRKKNPPVMLQPIMAGGSQEKGLRPGTLNVAGIVGLGKACEVASQKMDREGQRLLELRDRLIEAILAEVPEARLNGHRINRLYNNVSFSFEGFNPDSFALGLSGLAVSSSSACTSNAADPSHVLKAIGHDKDLAKATVRIGLGRMTKESDIELVISKISTMLAKHRQQLMN